MNEVIAYNHIVDFLTSGPSLDEIIAYRHSKLVLDRVRYLEDAERVHMLTEAERAELAEYRRATAFMEQLKLRAARRMRTAQH